SRSKGWRLQGGLARRQQKAQREARNEVSCSGRAPFCLLLRSALGGEFQPISLVDKGDGEKQHTEHHEADDAVSAIQLRDIVDKDLANGERDQNQSLPAYEGTAADKAHN